MIMVCPIERVHEAIPMGERFFNLSGEVGVFSPEAFMLFWERQYLNDTGALLVDETANGFTSALGLIFYNEPWTGDLVASEVCWYSEGSGGVRLFKFAEQLAKACGAKVLYMQHLNNEDSQRASKLYTKNGFKLGYMRYLKEL